MVIKYNLTCYNIDFVLAKMDPFWYQIFIKNEIIIPIILTSLNKFLFYVKLFLYGIHYTKLWEKERTDFLYAF